jgi:hypothetical protein
VLEQAKIGRVTGGGSQLNELGGIAYADVEIELPIGQNARVIVRHGKKELNPREVRIPKH